MHKNMNSISAVLFFSVLSFFSQNVFAQFCEEKYFSCKVGGKEISLCGAQLGDNFNIMFNIGTETVAEFIQGEKLSLTNYAEGKMLLTSIHFKRNGTVYALTKCDGMECNTDKDSWLSIVKGNKKLKGSGFCEAGSTEGFTNLPITVDKKGNNVLNKKNFLANYFSINKNPKETFLTENIGWSD
jgi:uncharacterized lipoprotein YehR (DUF1307 family)